MLSTPFICCSSGVETDCSIVTASAPVYVVETLTCGGTISGNWARGRLRMAIKPTMTVRMGMTMAPIGRLMKNLEIIDLSPVVHLVFSLRSRRKHKAWGGAYAEPQDPEVKKRKP